jgi:hypothetical protein
VGLRHGPAAAGSEAILILYAFSIAPTEIAGSWTTYADIVIFGSAALFAMVGLLYSLRGVDEAPAPSETEAEPG